jgi:hypothetical protein
LAGLDVAEGEGSDAGAAEGGDGVADGLEHAADHALAAGVNGDLDAGAIFARAEELGVGGTGGTFFEHNSLFESCEVGLGWPALDLRLVDLLDAEARVGEAVGEVAVVGDEEEALGVGVETAGGVEAGLHLGQEVENGAAAAVVGGGGDGAAGLVEEEVALGLEGDGPAVYFYSLSLGVDGAAGIGDDLSIDADAAGADEVGSLTPGSDSCVGDEL